MNTPTLDIMETKVDSRMTSYVWITSSKKPPQPFWFNLQNVIYIEVMSELLGVALSPWTGIMLFNAVSAREEEMKVVMGTEQLK